MSGSPATGSVLFQAVTRPAAVAGLPMAQVLLLAMAVMAGFIASSSFLWLAGGSAAGYALLRWLSARDPHLVDILLLRARRLPPPGGGRGPGGVRSPQGWRHDG